MRLSKGLRNSKNESTPWCYRESRPIHVMNGGEIYLLQHILGHSHSSTTQRYAHFSKSFLVAKADTVCFSTKDNVIKLTFKEVM